MSGDLLRQSEKATILALKNDQALTSLINRNSIEPVNEQPVWPFIRIDGTMSIPQGRGCNSRSTVNLMVHSFAKPKYVNDVMTETARDYTSSINNAVVDALNGHLYSYNGRNYRFNVTLSQVMQDGAEADAYHGIASVTIRVFENGN